MKNFQILIAISIAFCVSCNHNSTQSIEEKTVEADYSEVIEKGIEIVGLSQAALSSALMSAMQEGGVEYALSFCNVKAVPIADSLSQFHKVAIMRVSDLNRNSNNFATGKDAEVIARFKNDLLGGSIPEPLVVENESGQKVFYQAIITNANCLVCHGKIGETLLEENHKMILSLYPEDKATGYESGQVRGAWKIVF
jgi:hypothetical protein